MAPKQASIYIPVVLTTLYVAHFIVNLHAVSGEDGAKKPASASINKSDRKEGPKGSTKVMLAETLGAHTWTNHGKKQYRAALVPPPRPVVHTNTAEMIEKTGSAVESHSYLGKRKCSSKQGAKGAARGLAYQIAGTHLEAMLEDECDPAETRVYSDGSCISGKVGAAAVLYRGGRQKKTLRHYLGSDKEHTVVESEGVGMLLALKLLRKEAKVMGTVTLGVDCQEAIAATRLPKSAPWKYPWDDFHRELDLLTRQHQKMTLLARWTPGHVGISGNCMADKEAKKAARGG